MADEIKKNIFPRIVWTLGSISVFSKWKDWWHLFQIIFLWLPAEWRQCSCSHNTSIEQQHTYSILNV